MDDRDRQFMTREDIRRLEGLLSGTWESVWTETHGLWARENTVWVGLTGPASQFTLKLESALADELLERFPEGRGQVAQGLLDPSPVVAAYCLVALGSGASLDRAELPAPLFIRKEAITVHRGCLRGEIPLAEFVGQWLDTRDYRREAIEAERHWAGRERACPRCGTRFLSVQNLGACPNCKKTFRASDPSS